jgi:transposase
MSQHRNAPRRRHSADFKMEVVSACGKPGASVAAVALAFGLNANLVRQWLRGRGFKRAGASLVVAAAPTRSQQFVPLVLPAVAAKPEAATPAGDIRVEVRRGTLQVNVSWPQSSGADCAAWLRELLR